MPYNTFTLDTLESIETDLGINVQMGDLVRDLQPVEVPLWLQDALERGFTLTILKRSWEPST